MAAAGVCHPTEERIRKSYAEGGLEKALKEPCSQANVGSWTVDQPSVKRAYFACRSIVFQMPNLLLLAGVVPTPPLCNAKHFAKLVYFEPACLHYTSSVWSAQTPVTTM